MKHTDYTVAGTPEACLTSVEGYLRSDEWTHPGHFSRPLTGNMVQFWKPRTSLIDSGFGWFILIALSVVTAGAFAVAYALYWLVFRSDHSADMQVIAAQTSRTDTRLTLKTDHPKLREDLDSHIRRELIEKEAARWSVEPETKT